uniref:Type II keratin K8 n=1 Tax=Callorhinchus milii TaxID=7868 RepID=V9KQS0_CALMI|eukprot:gi/632984404/ref/XP_007909122.1/ PREDICTED: keratin, type II cytoskeletal 8-like [Callorhinchus milii]
MSRRSTSYMSSSSRSLVPTSGNKRLSFSSQSSGFSRGGANLLAVRPSMGVSVSYEPHLSFSAFQDSRVQEKEQIKGLNNQFASFIQKVCFLEQQNVLLDKKLKELQKRKSGGNDVDVLFHNYCQYLKQKIDSLTNEKLSLTLNLEGAQALVEDCKNRYEDEINLRTDRENEFVLIKKDCDESQLNRIRLEAKRDALSEELEYLKVSFTTELNELSEQINSTNVLIEVDNNRKLDLTSIIGEVRGQYDVMIGKMKTEVSLDNEMKVESIKKDAGNYTDELRIMKIDITDMGRHTLRLNSEIDLLKQQKQKMESAIVEAEERGDMAVAEAKKRISLIIEALEKLKKEMMKKIKEYQELMNIKLALDIEIATYKKLLEGEESRLGNPVHVVHQSIRSGQFDMGSRMEARMGGSSSKSVIIKTIESQDGIRLGEY